MYLYIVKNTYCRKGIDNYGKINAAGCWKSHKCEPGVIFKRGLNLVKLKIMLVVFSVTIPSSCLYKSAVS